MLRGFLAPVVIFILCAFSFSTEVFSDSYLPGSFIAITEAPGNNKNAALFLLRKDFFFLPAGEISNIAGCSDPCFVDDAPKIKPVTLLDIAVERAIRSSL